MKGPRAFRYQRSRVRSVKGKRKQRVHKVKLPLYYRIAFKQVYVRTAALLLQRGSIRFTDLARVLQAVKERVLKDGRALNKLHPKTVEKYIDEVLAEPQVSTRQGQLNPKLTDRCLKLLNYLGLCRKGNGDVVHKRDEYHPTDLLREVISLYRKSPSLFETDRQYISKIVREGETDRRQMEAVLEIQEIMERFPLQSCSQLARAIFSTLKVAITAFQRTNSLDDLLVAVWAARTYLDCQDNGVPTPDRAKLFGLFDQVTRCLPQPPPQIKPARISLYISARPPLKLEVIR